MPVVVSALVRTTVSVVVLALTASLLAVTLGSLSAQAAAAGGRVHGDSRGLVGGCQKVYTYDYRVRTPVDDWSLEVTILNRAGRSVHADAFIGIPGRKGDPRHRKNVRYAICRPTTRPGRYRIRAKLTYAVPPSVPLGPTEDRVVRFGDRFRLGR